MSEPTPTPEHQRLETEIRELVRRLSAGTARLLDMIVEFDESRGWEAYGAPSCAAWISNECGFSPGTARERVRVGRALQRLPLLRAALQSGDISYSKCRIVTRHATAETEADYLDMALRMTTAKLERHLAIRRRAGDVDPGDTQDGLVTWRVLRNGKVRLEAVLTPDQFETFVAGLAAARDDMVAPTDQTEAPADQQPQQGPPDAEEAEEAEEAEQAGAGTEEAEAAAEEVAAGNTATPVLWFAGERSGRAGIEVLVAMARSQLGTAPIHAGGTGQGDGGVPADVAA